MRPGVFITVDVECSMGGAWGDPGVRPVPPARAMMGEYGGQALGVPLITGILRDRGLRATFFVEPFAEEQGHPGETERVCAHLVEHGQDVQLHVHPNHRHYGSHRRGLPYRFTDDMADLPAEEQEALVREGAARLGRWCGRAPVAFRAGNMGASEETLGALAAAGIRIDSSYAFPYAGGQCRFSPADPWNGSRWYGDVLEVALSGFRLPGWLPTDPPAKPLDLVGVSFEECREAIRRICGAGADAVVILHSFSLFKVRNAQYDGGRPNWIVTRRLRRLAAWLAAEAARYPVHTFADLAEAVAAGRYEARSAPPPRLSGARALVRKGVQIYNRFYWT